MATLTGSPDAPPPAEASAPTPVAAAVWRLREVLVCAALTGLCVTQEPGLVVPDTKLDMAVNPAGFLGRAVDLWTSQWQFGMLQNQATGYFFPMGPFFLLGSGLGMPAWLVQRLWMAALLCTAFLGVVRLARALGLGTPASRLVAGAVFALSPRALTLVGTVSLELLPYCVAPWAVLPLVRGAVRGSPRRAAALSGLAVLSMGGVNGASVACAVLPSLLFLLTRARGPGRRRLLGWWLAALVAATFWWLVPLLLLQRYGFPFLPYTESAAVTTGTTSLPAALRGATHWVGYLGVDGLPWWRSGWELATVPWLAVVTGLIACVGLAGLARRDLPERRFLIFAAVMGFLTLTAGNAADGGAAFAGPVREVLDGPLAALRNLHKFDVVLRLPLALATAHLLGSVGRSALPQWVRLPAGLAPRRTLAGLTAAAVVAVSAAAGTAGLTAAGGFAALPEQWRQAAAYLDRNAGTSTTLLLPGSNFGEYNWGRPMDEPIQPLLKSRWAVRSLVPAGSAGNARLLMAIDQRLAAGASSPGLAEVFARLGVHYLVVRNDLRPTAGGMAWPVLVHRTLDGTPGLVKVAEFGPHVGLDADPGGSGTWDFGLQRQYRAVEIYRVDRMAPRVDVADPSRALDLTGAPETLLDLADAGLLTDRAVILSGDGGRAGGVPVLADSLRSREVDFGTVRGNTSRTFTSTDRPSQLRATHDIVDPAWQGGQTVAGYDGIADVRASSTAADVAGLPALRDPSASPFAAIDGDRATAWLTDGAAQPVGQWLEVRLREPIRPTAIDLQVVADEVIGAGVTAVEVSTAGGSYVHWLGGSPGAVADRLTVPDGPTDWLRVTVHAVSGPDLPGRRAGIRELRIPGIQPERFLQLPETPSTTAAAMVVLAAAPDDRPACTAAGTEYVCAPDLIRRGEESGLTTRRFELASGSTVPVTGLARPSPAAALAKYDEVEGGPQFLVSSAWFSDPVASARALGDGDEGTAWWADPADPEPTLQLAWDRKRRVDRVRLRLPAHFAGSLAQTVRITGDDGIREATVGPDGTIRFTALSTRRLVIAVTSVVGRVNRSTAWPDPQVLPLALSGVDVSGVPEANPPRDLSRTVTFPCGKGPTLTVNGQPVPTTASGTLREVRDLQPLRYRSCGSAKVSLRAGTNEVSAPADRFVVRSAILGNPGGSRPAAQDGGAAGGTEFRVAAPARWDDQRRVVEVGRGGEALLAVAENFNPGWQATLNGMVLQPVRVDGWKQAWRIPAGSGGSVELVFAPGQAYQIAVFLGICLVALLIGLAVLPAGRRGPPLTHAGPESVRGAAVAAIVVTALLGGVVGAAAAVVVVVAFPRRAPTPGWIWLPALLGCLAQALASGWAYGRLLTDSATAALGALAVIPQGLILAAVATLLLSMRRTPRPAPIPPTHGVDSGRADVVESAAAVRGGTR